MSKSPETINFNHNYSIFELFDLLASMCGRDWTHYDGIYVGLHPDFSERICNLSIEDACIFFLLICESENIGE